MRKIIIAVCLAMLAFNANAQLTKTTVEQGVIEGLAENGLGSFKGIPFAQPPVGELRWKAPVKAAAWNGIYKAHEALSTGTGSFSPRATWNK